MNEGWALLSVLLRYPEGGPVEDTAALEAGLAALPAASRAPARRFLAHLAATGPASLRREYVAAFDFDRRATLELTYHEFGDRRDRGAALVRLKHLYRDAGLDLAPGHLPDHLAVLLELAARAEGAIAILDGFRPSIELIRARLRDLASPYADVLEALVAALPRLSTVQAERARRLAAGGPPAERVGLEPFGAVPFAEPVPR